jgi:hypothetical protein
MNPLIPAPDVLPVAWGWFQGLLMLTFPLHLLLMNAVLGFSAVSLYARLKEDEIHVRLAHELARALPILIAFTINFGVAPLLFLQVLFGNLFYTSSVLMAVYWLSVPFILIVAYYAVYFYDFRFTILGKSGMLPIALALAIFLALPFIFTSNMTLMLEPQQWTAYFNNRGGTILNADSRVVWPRYLHFITGGMAVGGLFVAVFGTIKGKRDPLLGELAVSIGMNLFTALTLLQILVGFWFLISLPLPVRSLFLGGSMNSTALFGAGLLFAFLVLAAGFRRRVFMSAALTVPLLYVMVFMRDDVRTGYLKPFFTPALLKVEPQYSPLILFAVTLIGGICTIAWMLRKTARIYR